MTSAAAAARAAEATTSRNNNNNNISDSGTMKTTKVINSLDDDEKIERQLCGTMVKVFVCSAEGPRYNHNLRVLPTKSQLPVNCM